MTVRTERDTAPFWFDWDYDRSHADTGTRSRYGNYLYQRESEFREIWADDPTVDFAALAWRIATGPILVPPLVCSHRRVMGASVQRSNWDGEMVADVTVVSSRPQSLANAKTADGNYYRDYRIGAWDEYEGIDEQDLTRNSYLLTNVRLLWQLPAGTLSTIKEVPASSDELFRRAVECLEVLVSALNREVAPVIAQLERGWDGR